MFLTCPSCSIGVASPAAMLRHLRACAPDLLPAAQEERWRQVRGTRWRRMPHGLPHHVHAAPHTPHTSASLQVLASFPGGPGAGLPPGGHPALADLLREAAEQEQRARAQALHWAFRSGERDPATGQLLRLGPQEVAQRMGGGVSAARCDTALLGGSHGPRVALM